MLPSPFVLWKVEWTSYPLHLRPWSEPLTMGGPTADELCATVSSETWEKRRASPFQHCRGSPSLKDWRKKTLSASFLESFLRWFFFLLFLVLFPTKYQCHVRFKKLSRARRVNHVLKNCNRVYVFHLTNASRFLDFYVCC